MLYTASTVYELVVLSTKILYRTEAEAEASVEDTGGILPLSLLYNARLGLVQSEKKDDEGNPLWESPAEESGDGGLVVNDIIPEWLAVRIKLAP